MDKKLKDLLLRDLCARLPYGVKVNNEIQGDFNIYGICENLVFVRNEICHIDFSVENIKPYLFPLSSMTEEQKKEFKEISKCEDENRNYGGFDSEGVYVIEIGKYEYEYDIDTTFEQFYFNDEIIDWLNRNHFDYRGLIEKGLAIDATNLNIYINYDSI